MKKENLNKLYSVWTDKNTIRNPIESRNIIEVVEQIASVFASGTYYYVIMNFQTQNLEFVSDSFENVLGIAAKGMTLQKFLDRMHPEDLEKMHEKEYSSLTFKLNHIPKEDITKYKTVYLMRLRHYNGSYRTILHQSKALTVSKDGKVFQTLCVHSDITHLNPTIDHKLSFISNERPSYYSLEPGQPLKLIENSFQKIFSKREKEIIELIAKGKTASEIASILFISEQTVQGHKKNILKKAHCSNTAELITNSIREGII